MAVILHNVQFKSDDDGGAIIFLLADKNNQNLKIRNWKTNYATQGS